MENRTRRNNDLGQLPKRLLVSIASVFGYDFKELFFHCFSQFLNFRGTNSSRCFFNLPPEHIFRAKLLSPFVNFSSQNWPLLFYRVQVRRRWRPYHERLPFDVYRCKVCGTSLCWMRWSIIVHKNYLRGTQ